MDGARAASAVPELLGDVRGEWRQEQDEHVHARLPARPARLQQCVGKLHHRRDRGVERVLLQVGRDLADRAMYGAIDGLITRTSALAI